MNTEELNRLLTETAERVDRYGKRTGLEFLDRATRGRLMDREHRGLVYDVCSRLHEGSTSALEMAIRHTMPTFRYVGESRGRMSSTSPNLQQIAKAVEPKQPTMTNDQNIANLEAQLAAAVAKKEADEAAQQRADQLQGLIELAAGTTQLLGDVRSLETGSTTATARACFVKFRTELGALAQSLGYKLVRVGDRTTAQVVRL